jgi:quercetin dioxygenase-like cupin family protein
MIINPRGTTMKKILSITAALAAVVPLGLWKATPAGAEPTMEISPGDTRPASRGPGETFTGAVSVTPLFDPNDARHSGAAEVGFSPGARSAWHSHPGGQTLIVTEGTGWVQQWGGGKQQINPGDVIWTPPGVKHWHGAIDTAAMTHIAIQQVVDGEVVDWMEHVTDEQYLG